MNPSDTPTVVAFPEQEVSTVDAYQRGLPSEATRQVYRRGIRDFDLFLGGRDLVSASRRDVEAWRAHLEAAGRAPATVAKLLSAISGYFDFAVEEGSCVRNPVANARRPKLSDVSPRRALSKAEVRALRAVPDASTLVGLRDAALLSVLAFQGWRISEALGLTVADLGEEQGHKVAVITGKGSKVARVPLAAPTWTALSAWTAAAGITSGPIFLAVQKGGRIQPGGAMSAQSAWKRVAYLARRAGITRPIHPHLLRHTAATEALAAGVPLHHVQDLLRHRSPETTRRYDSHRLSLNNPATHVLAAALGAEEE